MKGVKLTANNKIIIIDIPLPARQTIIRRPGEMAIVKSEERYRGCANSVFGSVEFFSGYLRKEYSKDESIAGKFTAAGFACFNYGVEDPQRFIDYVAKF